MSDLNKVIRDIVIEHPTKSVERICEEAFGLYEEGRPNKSHWTLYKGLNPEDKTAKLAAGAVIPLMRACGSIAPAEVIAAAMGYRLVPIESGPGSRCIKTEIIEAHIAVGDFLKTAAQHTGCPSVLLPLRRKVAKEMDDVLDVAVKGERGQVCRPGVQGPANVEMQGEPQ